MIDSTAMIKATYSPDDNKLRLYAGKRLDPKTLERIKAAGFKWAPKQGLFVAPMWTPDREDLLLELAGEIDDDDASLMDRAEERAERFDGYSAKRRADAEQANESVRRIADRIPLGQPILVGHHSERHARRDVERIHAGLDRACKFWRSAEYWARRAARTIAAAQHKESTNVRARRILALEADLRKAEQSKKGAEKWLSLYSRPGLTHNEAMWISNYSGLQVGFYESSGRSYPLSAWAALTEECPEKRRTVAQIVEAAANVYPARIKVLDRWIEHYRNRLAYERAMLEAAGGTPADQNKPEKGGAVRCWVNAGQWTYVKKVNRVSVTVEDNWGNGGVNFTRAIPLSDLKAVMPAADVEAARAAGRIIEINQGTGFCLLKETSGQDQNESGASNHA